MAKAKGAIIQHRKYLVKITSSGGYWLKTTDTIVQANNAIKEYKKDKRFRGPSVIYKLVEVIR